MAVKSETLKNGERINNTSVAAPLSRQYLDTSRRPGRVILGMAFVAYSSIGTVLGVQSDIAPALTGREDAAMLGLGIGCGVALIIFIAELLLAEVSLLWYSLVLAPDAWYTYRFSDWIGDIVRAHTQGSADTVNVVVFLVTAIFALAVAYFGERLLFGKRR